MAPFQNTIGSTGFSENFEGDQIEDEPSHEPSGAVELNNPQIRNSQAGR